MSRRRNLISTLRARARSLGRSVVLLFGLASVANLGAPCLAMAAAASDARADTIVVSHEHAAVSHDHGTHGHSIDHGERSHTAHPGSTPQQAPAPCAHCPLNGIAGHTASVVHTFCSAGEDASGQTASSPAPPLAKHLLLVATLQIPPPLAFRPPPRPVVRAVDVARSEIAPSLKDRVLLI